MRLFIASRPGVKESLWAGPWQVGTTVYQKIGIAETGMPVKVEVLVHCAAASTGNANL
jgi:hypothetical protein